MKLGVFAIAGALTGLAALVNAVRFNQIPSNAGIGLEMKVIAAVVVGGAAIRGGRGTLTGTFLGVVLLGDGRSGADVPRRQSAYWERAMQGAIILVRGDRRDAWPAAACPTVADGGSEHRDGTLARALVPERRVDPGAWRSWWKSPSSRARRAQLLHVANFFEITRLSVELGLLAVALTPVIVSGGIDLSVGAMMGLSAVVFGAAVRDWHLGFRSRPRLALIVGCAWRRDECVARVARLAFRRSS